MGGGVDELALFAGGGGGILGGRLLGWRTRCAVELDPYARRILLARQRDGMLDPFPIWDDVTTFDGRPWRGRIDVVSGGFPCQDISSAGKGAGIDGKRSGLWGEMARIVREVRPQYVFVENSPMLTSRGLGRVLGDLAEMGFDAEWGVLGARHAGAPHKRDRIWILAVDWERMAHPKSRRCVYKLGHRGGSVLGAGGDGETRHEEGRRRVSGGLARDGGRSSDVRHPDSNSEPIEPVNDEASRVSSVESPDFRSDRLEGQQQGGTETRTVNGSGDGSCPSWWEVEPGVGRVAHGVAHRVDRLRALGNGQVPAVAALAWRILKGRLDGSR